MIVTFATSPSCGGSIAGVAGRTSREYKRVNNGGYPGLSDCSINRMSTGGYDVV